MFSPLVKFARIHTRHNSNRLEVAAMQGPLELHGWARALDPSITDGTIFDTAQEMAKHNVVAYYSWDEQPYHRAANLGQLKVMQHRGSDASAIREVQIDGGERFQTMGELETLNWNESEQSPRCHDYVVMTSSGNAKTGIVADHFAFEVNAFDGTGEIENFRFLYSVYAGQYNYEEPADNATYQLRCDIMDKGERDAIPVKIVVRDPNSVWSSSKKSVYLSNGHTAAKELLGRDTVDAEISDIASDDSAMDGNGAMDWFPAIHGFSMPSFRVDPNWINTNAERRFAQTAQGGTDMHRVCKSLMMGGFDYTLNAT
jgi:hypothetical protein